MTQMIAPELVYLDGDLLREQVVEVTDGSVTAVRPRRSDDARPDAEPYLLLPALTDLQVNGGGGVMLNSEPTPEGMAAIIAAHRGLGTGWILPTVITDAPEVLARTVAAALEMKGTPGFLGLHIEGPHIAPARRGTHKEAFIRPLDETTIHHCERLRAAGIPVLLTLAPERTDPETITRLADLGVIVSAGHTEADAATTDRALAAGLSAFTHLFNAMPPMTSRAPGIVAAAIRSRAHVGLIADGIHVDWRMAQIACAARPEKNLTFLVSDAMATVGGPDHFTIYGQDIFVRDGALVNAEGSLAGAHIDMVTSLANAHHQIGLPLAEAIAMATDVPRAAMKLPPLGIATGLPAGDLLALDASFQRVKI